MLLCMLPVCANIVFEPAWPVVEPAWSWPMAGALCHVACCMAGDLLNKRRTHMAGHDLIRDLILKHPMQG